jgi:hypothetical protein
MSIILNETREYCTWVRRQRPPEGAKGLDVPAAARAAS